VPSSTSNAKELITTLSVDKSVPSMCPCLGSWVVEVLPRFGTKAHTHLSALLFVLLCMCCQIWNRGAQAPRTISLVSFESHCCHFRALFGAQWTRADCGLNAVDVAVARCTANSPAISAACGGSVWAGLVQKSAQQRWTRSRRRAEPGWAARRARRTNSGG
jgi:hypothetical protein